MFGAGREEEREMLPLCADEGVGTIVWSPLARGRLARSSDQARATTLSTRLPADAWDARAADPSSAIGQDGSAFPMREGPGVRCAAWQPS
jgi:aryl-alcohol dehydrogenase-like predicted oxidoreductase